MPMKLIKNSFNAGELSEYMAGRTDINKYHNGCSKLINATVLPHGGVAKRPGSEFIGKSPNKARLLPFEFSVDDALIIECSNLLMRFYKDGDRVYESDVEIEATGQDNPVSVLTDTAHGFSDDEWVRIEDVDTATSLNDKTYIVQNTGTAAANLVGHWKMDDVGVDTTIADASDNTNDGVLDGSTASVLTTAGAGAGTGTSIDLSLGGGSHYATIPDQAYYTFGDGSDDEPFSLSAWVYVPAVPAGTEVILSKYALTEREWLLYLNSGALTFILKDEVNGKNASQATPALTTSDWHHVVATYNGVGGSSAHLGMSLYIDGVLQTVTGSTEAGYVAMTNKTGDVVIGANLVNQNTYPDKIDDVRIYDVELSAAEAAELYAGGAGISGTIGSRSFTITDTEGNDIDGTGIGVGGAAGSCKRVYQIVSPYTSTQAFQVHTTQSADVMYMAHTDHPPKKLSRTSDTNWTIATVDFTGGPFLDDNAESTQTMAITGSTITGDTSDTVFVDTAQAWTDDELIGYYFYNITNDASLDITDNTANTVTLSGAGLAANIVGDEYVIIKNSYYIPAGMKNLTLTATGHTPFQNATTDVGTKWQLSHTRDDNKDSRSGTVANTWDVSGDTDTSAEIRVVGDLVIDGGGFKANTTALVERKQGNGEWQTFRKFASAFSYSMTESEDNVFFRVTTAGEDADCEFSITAKDQVWDGVATVTAKSSTSVAIVSATTDLYWGDVATTITSSSSSLWAEGAWGLYRSFPRTLTFFEDRLWWASTTNSPDTIWGSKTSDYENMEFSDIGLDDDAVTFPINDNEVSQIQWMLARQVLAVGGANKEYRFGASDINKPTTPSDRKATPQTSFGSDTIQPAILNDAIFFFQRQGRKLRAMKFDSLTEAFVAGDMTLLANTLLESAPVSMAMQRVPDSIVWVVRTDGVLLSFTYEPDEEVTGWARHLTQNSTGVETPVGFYEAVAVIHGSVEDEVWVSVKREIDGNTVRYIERFATRFFDEIDEAMMLDSAVVVSSAFEAQDIVLASDTVRCNSGLCNSSLCGGVPS